MSKIAVLGCGPAGLLAAWAVEDAGHEPIIYSRRQKSVIPGSVYLHRSVPGLTDIYPENHVQYIRLGDEAGYAEKVYGDASRATGWHNYFQLYPSWNAVRAYERLWWRYEGVIKDVAILSENMREIALGHARTITTLPADVTCLKPEEHRFEGAPYWIKTLPVPPLDANHDVVVYNGLPGDLWYRWSVLSGVCSIESTHDLWPNDPGVTKGVKATTNTCDCWPGNLVVRAGRWAEWRHGVLLNDAYDTALKAAREVS